MRFVGGISILLHLVIAVPAVHDLAQDLGVRFIEAICMLLKCGVDIQCGGRWGWTALLRETFLI